MSTESLHLTKVEKIHIKLEEEYRNEVKQELGKQLLNKDKSILKVLNAPIMLWFLTTVAVGIWTHYRDEHEEKLKQTAKLKQLDTEISSRLRAFYDDVREIELIAEGRLKMLTAQASQNPGLMPFAPIEQSPTFMRTTGAPPDAPSPEQIHRIALSDSLKETLAVLNDVPLNPAGPSFLSPSAFPEFKGRSLISILNERVSLTPENELVEVKGAIETTHELLRWPFEVDENGEQVNGKVVKDLPGELQAILKSHFSKWSDWLVPNIAHPAPVKLTTGAPK